MAKSRRKRSIKKQPETCLFCGLVLANYRNLVDHIHTHTQERPYPCTYCDSAFRGNSIRIGHEKNIHLQIKHKCHKCKSIYNDRANFAKHRKTCTGVGKEKVWPKLQTDKKTKRKNVKSKLKPRVISIVNHKIKPTTKPRSILVSKFDLNIKSKSYNSSARKPDLKPKKCKITKRNIKPLPIVEDEAKYPEFIWANNGPPCLPPPLPAQFLQFENDNKWDPSFFLNMNRYKEEDSMFSSNFKIVSTNIHTKTSKTEIETPKVKREPVAVEKSTKSKENLTTDDNNSFACHQCGKMFSKRGNLVRHAKIHDGDKPFICPFCKKGFSEKVNSSKKYTFNCSLMICLS